MSEKKKQKPLLHEPAMAKVNNGSCAHFDKLIRILAEQARLSNAATASMKYDFIKDDEIIDAEYVPEITVTVRYLKALPNEQVERAREAVLASVASNPNFSGWPRRLWSEIPDMCGRMRRWVEGQQGGGK